MYAMKCMIYTIIQRKKDGLSTGKCRLDTNIWPFSETPAVTGKSVSDPRWLNSESQLTTNKCHMHSFYTTSMIKP